MVESFYFSVLLILTFKVWAECLCPGSAVLDGGQVVHAGGSHGVCQLQIHRRAAGTAAGRQTSGGRRVQASDAVCVCVADHTGTGWPAGAGVRQHQSPQRHVRTHRWRAGRAGCVSVNTHTHTRAFVRYLLPERLCNVRRGVRHLCPNGAICPSACWGTLETRWSRRPHAWTLSWRSWRRCPTWPAVSGRPACEAEQPAGADPWPLSSVPVLRSQAVVCHWGSARHPGPGPHSLPGPLMSAARMDTRTDGRGRRRSVASSVWGDRRWWLLVLLRAAPAPQRSKFIREMLQNLIFPNRISGRTERKTGSDGSRECVCSC